MRRSFALVGLLLAALLLAWPARATAPVSARGEWPVEPGLSVERLPNQMIAAIRVQPESRLAAITVGVRGGSRVEDRRTLGAAHFMEHMFFQGTPRRPNLGDFDRDIEAVGGYNNAWTDTESINFQILVPAEQLDLGLDIMADLIVHSTFPADRLEKERRVVIEELNRAANDPGASLFELVLKESAAGHPIERQPSGDRSTVGLVDRETLLSYRDRFFVASNMAVAVVGGVDREAVFPRLVSAFSDLRQGPQPDVPMRPPPPARGRRIEVSRNLEHTEVGLGFPVAGLDSSDRYVLDLANAVLGGAGQRIFSGLVDADGLALDADTAYVAYADAGVWLASATCEPERVEAVIERLRDEHRRLADGSVTEAELAQARAFLAGRRELALEGVVEQSVALSDGLVRGDYQSPEDYLARLREVGPGDVQRVARQYLAPDKALVAVLGQGR